MLLSSGSTSRSPAGWRLSEQDSRSTLVLTAKRRFGIIVAGLYWGVAKWQGTGFWSRDRRFESCRPSRGAYGMRSPGRRTIGVVRVHV